MYSEKLKLCVIVSTYYRKDGSSKNNLLKMLKSLENQTYESFKLFLIGDDYSDQEEFENICKTYKGDIFYYNNQYSYRSYKFINKQNYWAIGGSKAIKLGLEKALNEGFNYYFHLDDDDIWLPRHIETVRLYLTMFPKSDFLFTRSHYCHKYIIPPDNYNKDLSKIGYNNYPPIPGHTCHSTHVYNLNTLGSIIIKDLEYHELMASNIHNQVTKAYDTITTVVWDLKKTRTGTTNSALHETSVDFVLTPTDARMAVRLCVEKDKYNSLYIPIITADKPTDGNIPEI